MNVTVENQDTNKVNEVHLLSAFRRELCQALVLGMLWSSPESSEREQILAHGEKREYLELQRVKGVP